MTDPDKSNWFSGPKEMLQEAEHLESVYADIHADERAISNLYNGRDTMDECEAERRGKDSIVNHLFAYDNIATAKAQLESTYNAAPEFIKVQVTGGIDSAFSRKAVGDEFSKILNRAIKRSRRLKGNWQSLCGDITLFGRGVLAWENRWDWLPRFSKPLVPMGSGTAPEDVPYMIIPRQLSLSDIERYLKLSDRKGSPWDRQGLLDAKKEILKNTPAPGVDTNNPSDTYQHEHEEAEDEGASLAESWRLKIPVYYVYATRPDGAECPVDLTIVARHKKTDRDPATGIERNSEPELKLFHKENYYSSASECFVPFFLGTANGGEIKWHNVLGLGRLNYSADVELEEFFNDAMTGSREQLRRLYRVLDTADVEEVTRWASGEEYSNLIPEGVKLEETPKNGNFPAAFTIMEQLRQVGQRNAQGSVSNTGGQDNTANELEVQALQRQSRDAQVMGNRMADFYETADTMAGEIVRRFLQPAPSMGDKGYREIKYFQDEMRARGIPIDLLRERKFGFFTNIKVTVSRVIGDGDRVREIMANRALESRLQLYPPESRQKILRHLTASDTGDHDLAEELVPLGEEKPDGRAEQEQKAHNENDMCDKHGITGYVPQPEPDDVHPTHLAVHLMGMQSDIQRHGARPWDTVDIGGFSAKFQHATQHLQGVPEGTPDRKGFDDALSQLAKAGDQIVKQVQQQQAEQQQDPEKVQKAILDREKMDLDQRKQANLESERDRRYELDSQKAAATESTNNARVNKEEAEFAHQQGRDIFNAQKNLRELQMKENDSRRDQAPDQG